LLEDINLAGAQGILVNVTAGLDLSIGEFEEVGTIVKAYASEDATVVVGTVIDPEMSNQIRVTVVATGLNGGVARPQMRADAARDAHPERLTAGGRDALSRGEALALRESVSSRAEQIAQRAAKGRGPLSASDYSALDKPTIVRQRAVGDGLRNEADTEELLDIPAFLRRQAD